MVKEKAANKTTVRLRNPLLSQSVDASVVTSKNDVSPKDK